MRRIKELIKDKARLGGHMLLGLVLVVYSSMALISKLGSDNIVPYSFVFSNIMLELVLVILGLFVVYDTIRRTQDMRPFNFVFGLFLIFFGGFPMLVDFNLLRFLPVTIEITPNYFLMVLILFLSSVYFTVDRFFAIFRKEYS